MIEKPNSCGQGYDPTHCDHPYHGVITKYGWVYSHTTPIRGLDGRRYYHHTYKYPTTEWYIGVSCRNDGRYIIAASTPSRGRHTVLGDTRLEGYLKRKSAQLRRLLV